MHKQSYFSLVLEKVSVAAYKEPGQCCCFIPLNAISPLGCFDSTALFKSCLTITGD